MNSKMETEQKKIENYIPIPENFPHFFPHFFHIFFSKNFYWLKSCALKFQGDLWGSNPEFKVISGSGMAKNTLLDKIVQKPTQLLKLPR